LFDLSPLPSPNRAREYIGRDHMTTQTSTRTHGIWQDTRPIVSTAKTHTPRPTHTEQPRPTPKTKAEQEAERWVAEMMFDHYNG
jgi:hypothetical protein